MRCTAPHVFLLASALGLGAACSGDAPPGAGSEQVQGPVEVPTRVLRDVVGSTLARLGVEARAGELSAPELRVDNGLLPGSEEGAAVASEDTGSEAPEDASPLDPELVELREGLIGMVEGNPKQLGLAKKDIAHLKDEIVEVMVAGFHVEGRTPEALKILIDLAVEAPAPEIALEVARVAASAEEVWLKRYAAWSLSSLAATPGTDQVIPLLLRRLKYERDPETLVWVGSTLAAFGNFAGTDALYQTTAHVIGDTAGDTARAQLAVVLERAGAELGLEERPDTAAVWAAWNSGLLGRSHDTASEALLGAVWTLLADLSGEHFQLRGVDDARHTLSSLGPWAAMEFALALEDDDEYVRLHTTQVLERMGGRGLGAMDSLLSALHDPHDAVAGAAAEALVAVSRGTARSEEARTALLARMDVRCAYETRVACIRALGHMDPKEIPANALLSLFQASKLSDLRLAAADGLLRTAKAGAVGPWLIDELEAEIGDPAGAEAVLGRWLASLPSESAQAAQAAWENEAAPMSVVHTGAQAKARRAARAAALRTALPTLVTTAPE